MFDKDSLYYFEKNDAYTLMESTIIDQTMQEVFRGSEKSHQFLLYASSNYQIITQYQNGKPEDYESQNRFKAKVVQVGSHAYTLQSFAESVTVKT
jgi:hypothetical protein